MNLNFTPNVRYENLTFGVLLAKFIVAEKIRAVNKYINRIEGYIFVKNRT